MISPCNSSILQNSNILNGLKSSRNFSLENINKNSKKSLNPPIQEHEEHTWRAKSKSQFKREYSPIMELENEESDISCTYSNINNKSEFFDTQYQQEVYTQKLVNNLKKEVDFLRHQNNELRDALFEGQKKFMRSKKKSHSKGKSVKVSGEVKRNIQNLFLGSYKEIEKINQNISLKVEKSERRVNKACMNLMYILNLFEYREKKKKENEEGENSSKINQLEEEKANILKEKDEIEMKLKDMQNRVEALQRKFQDSSRTRVNKNQGKEQFKN